MHQYRKLDIWKASINFVDEVYKITEGFPKFELYGLANQLQRAAVSVPSNIAEGSGRGTDKDFAHFLDNSMGSLAEVDTQIVIAQHRGYLTEEKALDMQNRMTRLAGMIYNFKQTLMPDTKVQQTS